jgi:nucleotide-binding universal stress UspA family protein
VNQISRILVPTDFSTDAENALDYAIGLALTLSAEIHVLHVRHFPALMIVPDQIAKPESFWDEMHRAALERLDELLRRVTERGVMARIHMQEGPPASVVVKVSRELPADLIVMGTRGHTGLKHVALGSVAERVVRLAPCPVITLRGEEGG